MQPGRYLLLMPVCGGSQASFRAQRQKSLRIESCRPVDRALTYWINLNLNLVINRVAKRPIGRQADWHSSSMTHFLCANTTTAEAARNFFWLHYCAYMCSCSLQHALFCMRLRYGMRCLYRKYGTYTCNLVSIGSFSIAIILN